jgi:hypothetical protein
MMEAARISETSVDIYLTTRQYIPEDPELHFKMLILWILQYENLPYLFPQLATLYLWLVLYK